MEERCWRLYSVKGSSLPNFRISHKETAVAHSPVEAVREQSQIHTPGTSSFTKFDSDGRQSETPSSWEQSTVMPLFSWMKWSHETRGQAQDEAAPLKTSGVVPSGMLIKELLWHVEEREHLARELEQEHRLAHSALGLRWFQKYPRLRTLIPTSELHQLEFLCAQIPPIHAATVLSRFRKVLATNNIRPWELASVFKQFLRDFLSQKEYDEEDDLSVLPALLRPMEAWTSRYKMKQGFVTPTVPSCGEQQREEIPTISGYVDRAMRHSSSNTGSNRDWNLPNYYPVPLRPAGAYSTTL